MIKIYQKRINDSTIKEISEFKTGSLIFVNDAGDKDIDYLEKNFGLNKDILKDAKDIYEAPRIELDNQIVYIFIRTPQKQNGKIITTPLLLIVGSDFVVVFSVIENQVVGDFISNNLNFTTTQKTQLIVKILSETIKTYNSFLLSIIKDVRSIGAKFNKIDEKVIIDFVSFEEILNDFLMALNHTNPVLKNITNGRFIQLYKEDHDLIEDLVLNSNQLIELCTSSLKNIANIRNAYSTIITNELNRVIKLFTSLTVILTIPTIVASLYGMNVKLPFAEDPHAFWILIDGTFFAVLLVFFIFSKKRWL